MLKEVGSLLFTAVIIFTLKVNMGYSQDSTGMHLTLMFYNVENLFDVYNDTTKDDDEFLPEGEMRWTENRYKAKINLIYKTIVSAGDWGPPELIAFSEVENRDILNDMIHGTYLSKYDWGIIHEDSPDRRGIDVCLLYKKNFIKILNYNYWTPEGFRKEGYTSRTILYAKAVSNSDTFHLIVNHWPSRRGGVLAGEDLRRTIASTIRGKVDSIALCSRQGAKIVIMGDFNCTPVDREISLLTQSSDPLTRLVDLSAKQAEKGIGTYRYMGSWEMIDQVIVSDKLLTCSEGLYTEAGMLKVFSPGFLLIKDPKYPGFTPFATYRGYKYMGGVSDHLPVILRLGLKSQVERE